MEAGNNCRVISVKPRKVTAPATEYMTFKNMDSVICVKPRVVTPDTEEINVILPAIESFSKRMTKEQWGLMNLGTPDHATNVLLAELLLDIIKTLSQALLKARSQNVAFSEENVRSSMGDKLSQSFSKVLNVEDQVPCVSSISLTNLLAKEVADICKSSPVEDTAELLTLRVTTSKRLNAMVCHACKMLKSFTVRMKIVCSSRPRSQRQSPTASEEQLIVEDDKKEATDVRCSLLPFATTALEPETPEVSSEDSSEMTIAQAVEYIIREEMSKITEPLLDDLPETEYEQLKSESSLEILIVAKDIAQSIVESLDKRDAAEQKPKHKLCMKKIGNMIKTFFAKCFVKTWIHRMLEQLKAKFHQGSKVESGQSVSSILDDIDSLLQPPHGGKAHCRNNVAVFRDLKKISSGKDLVFTKALCDLLSRHISPGMAPNIIPDAIRDEESHRTHPDLYADIQSKMWSFLGILRWWLNTKVGDHSQEALEALGQLENRSLAPRHITPTQSAEACEDATAKTSRNRMSIKVILQKLLSRTLKKAKVDYKFKNTQDFLDRLLTKTWAQVEGVDFNTTTKTFRNLDKDIFQDVCKKWGCAEEILVSVTLGEQELEDSIACCFKHHLMKSQKTGFFASMCKAISNFCSSRNRVGV
ncbi:uncharacterized protein LOC117956605 [Etheostoma cragini]|uniref:uncharacterized protein LOC117956605 n=1 Tax=Etheostoma cragini TaxID=417921 RepID=UPI00155E33EE|nr:uncharacterized protein LOC117956605 [Etheostoma cragini]